MRLIKTSLRYINFKCFIFSAPYINHVRTENFATKRSFMPTAKTFAHSKSNGVGPDEPIWTKDSVSQECINVPTSAGATVVRKIRLECGVMTAGIYIFLLWKVTPRDQDWKENKPCASPTVHLYTATHKKNEEGNSADVPLRTIFGKKPNQRYGPALQARNWPDNECYVAKKKVNEMRGTPFYDTVRDGGPRVGWDTRVVEQHS